MTATNFGVMPWREKFALGASSIGRQASKGLAPIANTLNPSGRRLGPNRAASDWNSSIICEQNNFKRLGAFFKLIKHSNYLIGGLSVNENIAVTAFNTDDKYDWGQTTDEMHVMDDTKTFFLLFRGFYRWLIIFISLPLIRSALNWNIKRRESLNFASKISYN